MPIKAVVFDMDGVLVDSMRYHVIAWQRAFRPIGLSIPAREVYAREGESWRKSTKDFLLMAGRRPSKALIDEIFSYRCRIFEKIFKPRIFSGVKSLLALVDKAGLKLALVTATPYKDVKKMLPADILRFFDAMVCGGDTKRGKPHPEPYLRALKLLKIKPADTVVIENAPYGIKSCKLAGIKCVAVSTSLPRKYLKGADIVVDSLKKVKGAIFL